MAEWYSLWTPRFARRTGGAVLVLGALLTSLVVAGWAAQARDALRQRQGELARFEALASQKGRLEGQIQALKRAYAEDAARFIAGETMAQASAGLQDHVGGVVSGRGGRVQSAQLLDNADAPDGAAGLSAIRMRIVMSATNPALRDILHALETATPAVVIDRMTVQPGTTMRRFRTDFSDKEPLLDITMDVRGFRRPDVS